MIRALLLAALTALALPAAAQELVVRQTPEGYLNLRDGPGTRHDVLRRLSPGDAVRVEETMGRWAHVRLPSGTRGWVSSDYLEPAPDAGLLTVAATSVGYLNLRDGPGTDRGVLRRLSPGERLRPFDARGDWIAVRLSDGTEGWVHGAYIRR